MDGGMLDEETRSLLEERFGLRLIHTTTTIVLERTLQKHDPMKLSTTEASHPRIPYHYLQAFDPQAFDSNEISYSVGFIIV